MKLDKVYEEKVYAGVLGKLIGVYLGRPFEQWTHERILEELGEINYYVNEKLNVPLEISPKIVKIFKDGKKKYGSRAWSSMIVKRMEDLNKINFRADGFPDELVDNEPEEKGYEI